MRYLILILAFLHFSIYAGDDSSGSIPMQMDLSQTYKSYELTHEDKDWSNSLVANFGYKGSVLHFVKTDIVLKTPSVIKSDLVYQCIEKPELYYVSHGDLMFKLNSKYPYSPGVGGFSMHSPKSKNFIVCLNCSDGGVPNLKSGPVKKGIIKWYGSDYSRL